MRIKDAGKKLTGFKKDHLWHIGLNLGLSAPGRIWAQILIQQLPIMG